ncbi:MAG TPA: protein TolR [Sphingomonadales bacterium]
MAMQLQGPGQRGGFTRRRPRPMSEINVTPFVDVMLVLLIVFMVAAPLLTVGVAVDLPQSSARPLQEDNEPLSVTINADGAIFIQDEEVTLEELVPKLSAIAQAKRDNRIYVRGDRGSQYGRVAEVMGALSGAGFTRLALITDPKQ